MQKLSLNVKLLTPCFLGDASQSGVWRTPPFKALLREWWRVAAAPSHRYEHSTLRQTEGRLLGNAWLEKAELQSKVRMALRHWDAGKMTQWEKQDPSTPHDEVKGRDGNPKSVGSQLYLGYGPLTFNQGTALKENKAALEANEPNELSLAWPDSEITISHAIQLAHWFGTIGGRSRNGWGSLDLGLESLSKDHAQFIAVQRELRECLKLDWPHAIGKDNVGALVWESATTFPNWQDAMKFLAQTKIGFRTSLKFPNERTPHRDVQERHLLAYPVTHHDVSVRGWDRNTRLANQLRFKLFHDSQKKLRARIYHTPHKSPLAVGNLDQLAVWQKIHRWLDEPKHGLRRLGAAA